MALEQFANAPLLDESAWTTTSGAIDASQTTVTVASASAFPSSAQFRIKLETELALVTAGAGSTTWTITRAIEGTTAATHASGTAVYGVLSAAALLRSPGAMSTTGDLQYLGASGEPTRLAAGTDSQFVRYSSGLPVAGAIVLGDLPSGVGLTASALSQFAATTSAQLRGVLSDETGTGAAVFADTPTLIAPLLGTPTSGLLSNCTGLPLASVTGLGTGVATFLATPSSANLAAALTDETGSGAAVFGTSPTIVTPTIASFANATHTHLNAAGGGTLTLAAISDFGTGVATFLGTPTSANLAAAITNETGTGVLVFNDTPTILTPTIASLVNATHTHQNAAGGGTLDAAAIAAGTLAAARGGTGVSNTGTITLGGNLTTSGAFATTFTMTAATGVTFPTTGTLATLAGSEALTNKTLNGNTFTAGTYTLTGVAGKTLTFNKSLTLEGTDSTTMTFPTTSATIARTDAAQTFTVNGALSTPGETFNGTWITGGTATTTKPYILIEVTGATSAAWNTSGTGLGINAAAGFSGNLIDAQVNGSAKFFVDRFGQITAGGTVFNSSSANSALLAGGVAAGSDKTIGFSSTTNAGVAADTFFARGGAAATMQLGADLNGAAISQTLQACNGITGSDKSGGSLTLNSGKGTGAGTVSQVLIGTPTALGSGTTAQSITTRVTIDVNGLKATKFISSDGTSGATAGPFTTITSITCKDGIITALTGA